MLVVICMTMVASLQAQLDQVVQIRPKRTLWIPKIDLFWSGVVIAENFPTFFPLELEFNMPNTRFALTAIASPWAASYQASQTTYVTEASFIGGLGLRFYALKSPKYAGQGLFIEPQVFYRWHTMESKYQPSIATPEVVTNTKVQEFAYMGALGYQHQFFHRFYAQARVSIGYGQTQILSKFQHGDLLVLPWLGIGMGF